MDQDKARQSKPRGLRLWLKSDRTWAMFTRQNERPKVLPGAGPFARCLADGKLWQRDEEKPEKRAGGKPTRKKRRPNVQPARADPFTKSRAAGVSANAGGDIALQKGRDIVLQDGPEKRGPVVSAGSRSSSLGGPGERNFYQMSLRRLFLN